MDFRIDRDGVKLVNEIGDIVGEVDFSSVDSKTIDIYHTYVDPSLRGQGWADRIMTRAVDHLRAGGMYVRPTCSYAKTWFNEHKEYASMLARDE